MKKLVAVLVLLAFLQTTLISINLVLLVIVLRAYLRVDLSNLYLAFFFGLLVAYLNHTNLGLTPIMYLILTNITHLLAKTPLSKNIISVLAIAIITSALVEVATSLIAGQTPSFLPKLAIEGILSLPIYLILKIWEERFVVRSQIKLKVR